MLYLTQIIHRLLYASNIVYCKLDRLVYISCLQTAASTYSKAGTSIVVNMLLNFVKLPDDAIADIKQQLQDRLMRLESVNGYTSVSLLLDFDHADTKDCGWKGLLRELMSVYFVSYSVAAWRLVLVDFDCLE